MQRLNLTTNDNDTAPDRGAALPANEAQQQSQADANIVSDKQAIDAVSGADMPTISMPPESGQLTPGNAGSGVAVGSLIDGKTATELMDSVLPAVLVFALYKAGLQLKKTELQLTEREKNTLAPLMQKCMDALMLNFDSPFVALGVSMTVIYGGKIMEKGGVAWLDKQAIDNAATSRTKTKPVNKIDQIMKRKDVQQVVNQAAELPHQFTPEAVEAFRKKRKIPVQRAIPLMLRLVENGKMDLKGNPIN